MCIVKLIGQTFENFVRSSLPSATFGDELNSESHTNSRPKKGNSNSNKSRFGPGGSHFIELYPGRNSVNNSNVVEEPLVTRPGSNGGGGDEGLGSRRSGRKRKATLDRTFFKNDISSDDDDDDSDGCGAGGGDDDDDDERDMEFVLPSGNPHVSNALDDSNSSTN
jgi:hypothetical protein